MPVYHDRVALLEVVKAMSDKALVDGVLIDHPKSRRREQAINPQKPIRLMMDADLKKRLATQINRFIEYYGKGVGLDVLIGLLEAHEPHKEDSLSEA